MRCRICGSEVLELGLLGWCMHYRCQHCGAEGYRQIKEDQPTTRLGRQLARRLAQLRGEHAGEIEASVS